MKFGILLGPLFGLLLVLAACVQPKGDEYKSSELSGFYSRTPSAGSVLCDAHFALASDPSQTPVTLEPDAIVTCNGAVMTRSGPYFSATVSHDSGEPVAISLIRRVDGSTLTDTEIVY